MTIEELKYYKRIKGYTYDRMAQLSGVPLGTIQKIFSGETLNPRVDTMRALELLFCDTQEDILKSSKNNELSGQSKDNSWIREEGAYSIHSQGNYTVEDYYAMPDDRRVELIDGYIYDMSSLNSMHQKIMLEVAYQIGSFIKKKKGECELFVAPLDVRLDCDNKTMVQPDIMIVCDRKKIKKWGIMGAPDFVVEVVSPSSKNKDYALKAGKYMNAKVREYWVLDPYKRVVIKYDYENEKETTILGMETEIPVGIYKGELLICFEEINRLIDEFGGVE